MVIAWLVAAANAGGLLAVEDTVRDGAHGLLVRASADEKFSALAITSGEAVVWTSPPELWMSPDGAFVPFAALDLPPGPCACRVALRHGAVAVDTVDHPLIMPVAAFVRVDATRANEVLATGPSSSQRGLLSRALGMGGGGGGGASWRVWSGDRVLAGAYGFGDGQTVRFQPTWGPARSAIGDTVRLVFDQQPAVADIALDAHGRFVPARAAYRDTYTSHDIAVAWWPATVTGDVRVVEGDVLDGLPAIRIEATVAIPAGVDPAHLVLDGLVGDGDGRVVLRAEPFGVPAVAEGRVTVAARVPLATLPVAAAHGSVSLDVRVALAPAGRPTASDDYQLFSDKPAIPATGWPLAWLHGALVLTSVPVTPLSVVLGPIAPVDADRAVAVVPFEWVVPWPWLGEHITADAGGPLDDLVAFDDLDLVRSAAGGGSGVAKVPLWRAGDVPTLAIHAGPASVIGADAAFPLPVTLPERLTVHMGLRRARVEGDGVVTWGVEDYDGRVVWTSAPLGEVHGRAVFGGRKVETATFSWLTGARVTAFVAIDGVHVGSSIRWPIVAGRGPLTPLYGVSAVWTASPG